MADENNVKLEIVTKCLVKFDGDRAKLREFIDNCEIALKLVSQEDKIILFEIIKTKITGRAKQLSQNREFDNWNALKTHLENTYSEKRSQAQWELELHSCKQGRNESVRAYANRVENCMVKLLNSLDSDMTQIEIGACEKLIRSQTLNVFISGLNDPLITIIKAHKPACLEDAFDLAIAEEREIISRQESQKYYSVNNANINKKCFNCNKFGHISSNCRTKQYDRALYSTKIKTEPVNAFQQDQKPQYNSQNQCRYCKKPGHTINECRKLKYKNSQTQNTNRNSFNHKTTVNQNSLNLPSTSSANATQRSAETLRSTN